MVHSRHCLQGTLCWTDTGSPTRLESSSLVKFNCFLMFCHCLHIPSRVLSFSPPAFCLPSRVLSFSPPAFCLSHSVLLAGKRATTAQIHETKTFSLRPLSQLTFLISKFLELRRDNAQRLPEQRRKLLYTSILKIAFWFLRILHGLLGCRFLFFF